MEQAAPSVEVQRGLADQVDQRHHCGFLVSGPGYRLKPERTGEFSDQLGEDVATHAGSDQLRSASVASSSALPALRLRASSASRRSAATIRRNALPPVPSWVRPDTSAT